MHKIKISSAVLLFILCFSSTVSAEREYTVANISPRSSFSAFKEDVFSLDGRIQTLLDVVNTSIEQEKERFYQDFSVKGRYEYQHITYSTRMVFSENQLIYNTTSKYSDTPSANSLDLRTPSSITAYEIDSLLDGTELSGLGRYYIQAEQTHGVNALFLVSLSVHESGWGRSDIARLKNNLFGYKAYDASPFESAHTFKSKSESIMHVAKHLSDSYLSKEGAYFSGGYTLSHVNRRYASDTSWSNKIASTMASFDRRIISNQDIHYHNTLSLGAL